MVIPSELLVWRQTIASGQVWSLKIKVMTNCQRRGWLGQMADGSWKIGLAEPAINGRANQALLLWLANELGCNFEQLMIISGKSVSRKIIRFIL
jgi:hypothetical protein